MNEKENNDLFIKEVKTSKRSLSSPSLAIAGSLSFLGFILCSFIPGPNSMTPTIIEKSVTIKEERKTFENQVTVREKQLERFVGTQAVWGDLYKSPEDMLNKYGIKSLTYEKTSAGYIVSSQFSDGKNIERHYDFKSNQVKEGVKGATYKMSLMLEQSPDTNAYHMVTNNSSEVFRKYNLDKNQVKEVILPEIEFLTSRVAKSYMALYLEDYRKASFSADSLEKFKQSIPSWFKDEAYGYFFYSLSLALDKSPLYTENKAQFITTMSMLHTLDPKNLNSPFINNVVCHMSNTMNKDTQDNLYLEAALQKPLSVCTE